VDDPETTVSSYLEQTPARIFQSKRPRLGDGDTDSEESVISTPMSEVITTPSLLEMDHIRVRLIDFGVCELFLFCLFHSVLGPPWKRLMVQPQRLG
jgi:hypothetical protein